ncbi:MAG UNVERIFIED_CONTAM: hypothetical protein LVR18_51795 [Planctomycetaceae bacterium]
MLDRSGRRIAAGPWEFHFGQAECGGLGDGVQILSFCRGGGSEASAGTVHAVGICGIAAECDACSEVSICGGVVSTVSLVAILMTLAAVLRAVSTGVVA